MNDPALAWMRSAFKERIAAGWDAKTERKNFRAAVQERFLAYGMTRRQARLEAKRFVKETA